MAKILVYCPTRTYRYFYFHLLLCSMTKVKRIQKGNLLLKYWHCPASEVQKAANALIHWVCWFKTFCVNFRSPPPFFSQFSKDKSALVLLFLLSLCLSAQKNTNMLGEPTIFSVRGPCSREFKVSSEIHKDFDNRIPIKGILAFPTFYIHEILEVLTYILIRTFMFSIVCQLFSS